MSRMLLHLRLWRSCWPPPPAAFDQHLHIPAAGGDFSTPATLPAAGVASLQTQLQISSLAALCRASKMSPTPTFRAHSHGSAPGTMLVVAAGAMAATGTSPAAMGASSTNLTGTAMGTALGGAGMASCWAATCATGRAPGAAPVACAAAWGTLDVVAGTMLLAATALLVRRKELISWTCCLVVVVVVVVNDVAQSSSLLLPPELAWR